MFLWLAENPVGNLNFMGKYAMREDMLGLLLIHQASSEHKSVNLQRVFQEEYYVKSTPSLAYRFTSQPPSIRAQGACWKYIRNSAFTALCCARVHESRLPNC